MPNALNIGLTISQFYELDLREVRACFESYKVRSEAEQKDELSKHYNLAVLIAMMVNCQLTGHDFPSIKELYPEQFPTTEEDMKGLCEQFKAYAEAYNASRKDTRNES